MRDESMYSVLVIGGPTKKGRGQRRNRRNAAGRQLHQLNNTYDGYHVHLQLKLGLGLPVRQEEVDRLKALAGRDRWLNG